ncbi:MAG: hypothetical protein A2521_07860 [Deltaproteobacteria bacterium RIFOXYD12_FULL_57_12]|nr:MAG: hypothetical protein A2521_07860 [Deltaproteobacteria bacterium RIFOXYD12_FULL_57_12]
MLEREKCTLYSGGLKGAEVAFGEAAEQWGIKEVTFSFAGHKIDRDRNAVVLNDQELRRGDISMELVSRMMGRTYYETEKIRKVLQAIFHMVNSGHQVFAVGTILEDNTVKGGTGWAVELAKLFNRPLSVYDQVRQGWYTWQNKVWEKDTPRISHPTFVGSGTRYITDDGVRAIQALFVESFGKP